ncbi:hypothetical protein MPH_13916 [Macrophomina phaseolina MS6]|uniref:Uncharacterized protein n=1 Tax=Macrophomina phaseolina (strain MS6) TaxID=1126212 RepID=K2R870_MACPH|nr:hypothetical protein MPH_13916 [Macrophomina phaseolina MS6]
MKKTVSLEKRRRKRGQALLSNLFEMTQGESIFISPKKIIKAREQLERKEHEKEQAERAKEEAKIRKQALKEEKQQQAEHLKAGRQQAKIQKAAEKEEAKRQKEARQRLQQETKQQQQAAKSPQKKPSQKGKNTAPKRKRVVVEISDDEATRSQSLAKRPRRARNPQNGYRAKTFK